MSIRDSITIPKNKKICDYEESDLLLAIRFSKLGTNFDIAKKLLESYGNINKVDKNECTLLITSLFLDEEYINTNIIKLIIEKGANINNSNHEIMHFINKLENEEFLSNKLKKALVHCIDGIHTNYIPLIIASSTDIVEFLLEKGANINEQNEFKKTFLIKNVEYGNIEYVKIALREKADVDITSNYDRTALSYAVEYGNHEIIKLLLDSGSNMYFKKRHQSPFEEALYKNIEIAKLFFMKGAKIEMLENNGINILEKYIKENNFGMVELLIIVFPEFFGVFLIF